MEEIKNQVRRARRRLILQQFLTIVTWSLFAALIVAVIGVAIPKLWVVNVETNTWMWSWFGGAIGVGLLSAILWTYLIRRGSLEAAIEIDRRFGLKERVSSALALGPEEAETEIGRALLTDASRRVARLNVGEQFRVKTNWRSVLPLLPAALLFLIALLPAAEPPKSEAREVDQAMIKRIKNANEALRKKIEAQRKKAEEQGLKDAAVVLKELRSAIDKRQGDDSIDKKKAMIKLNDLKKELAKQRSKLGGADEMRKHFDQMKNIQQGPADKLAEAVKDGDLNKAMNELKNLQQKLAKGEMSQADQQAMANQMQQMQKKMEEIRKAHEQAKKDLEQKKKQAEAAGNQQEVEKLQKQLDQLEAQDQNMQQMQQMANKLGQIAQSLKQGDQQAASQQLSQMSDQLQQLKQQLDQLETLDEVLDQIASSKNAMNCDQCQGMGCQSCQGQLGQWGMGQNRFGPPGFGMGEGRGRGERPEEETDTGDYRSRVKGDVGKGEAVLAGEVGGKNLSGKSRESVKQEIESSMSAESDPLTNLRLPRAETRHAKEYFERFRDRGEK